MRAVQADDQACVRACVRGVAPTEQLVVHTTRGGQCRGLACTRCYTPSTLCTHSHPQRAHLPLVHVDDVGLTPRVAQKLEAGARKVEVGLGLVVAAGSVCVVFECVWGGGECVCGGGEWMGR